MLAAKHSLAKDMSPPKPSLLLLEMVELGELLRESPSPSDSPGSLRLLGRRGRSNLRGDENPARPQHPAETTTAARLAQI